jgi:hypothetical protein
VGVQALEERCQPGAGADGGHTVCEVEGAVGCGGGLFDFACGEVGVAEPGPSWELCERRAAAPKKTWSMDAEGGFL